MTKLGIAVRQIGLAALALLLSAGAAYGANPGKAGSAAAGASDPSAGAARTCPAGPIEAPVNRPTFVGSDYPEAVSYATGNPAVFRVTAQGLIVPQAQGSAKLTVTTPDGAEPCVVQVKVGKAVAFRPAFEPKYEQRKVKAAGKTFAVRTVRLPKGIPADIGLAGGKVGGTAALKSIATSGGAQAAINGTYFEAYGGIPEPWGTLIKEGEPAHVTLMGTSIGFAADGTAKMDTLRLKIEGGADGSYAYPNNWYATFVNRTPVEGGNASILFTPARGARIGFAYGKAIVVRDGKVVAIADNKNVAIPKDGFVVVLTGSAIGTLSKKFALGKQVHYRLNYLNMEGARIDWSDVVTATGAGPRVLKDGKVAIQAEKEGFAQAKILTTPAARSGIGIMKDGSLLLVTVDSATIRELGEIFRALGAAQAMNLDGGASSGLIFGGKTVTEPGRQISNALLFGAELKS